MKIKTIKLFKFSKIYVLLISIFLFCSFINGSEIQVDSDKYFLYNLTDNEVLLEKKSDEKAYIASLTKIMTTITAIENINNLNEKITITKQMISGIDSDVAVVGFEAGDIVTYEDLLYSSILKSGADATNTLAISISGSINDFVALMNKTVKKLKLKNTNFANTTGLFDENNYSSAHDMAMILKYALQNETFKKIFETHEYTLTNGISIKSTINRSGDKLGYIKGAKTGYIKAAGFCLASTAYINDAQLLLITLNAKRDSDEFNMLSDTTQIYDYVKENYKYIDLVKETDKITSINVKHSKEKEVDIKANVNYKKFIPFFDEKKLKIDYEIDKEVTYFTPIETVIGKATISYNEEKLFEFDLMYNENVKLDLISYLTPYTIYLVVAVILLIVLIKIIFGKKRKKK